MNILAAILILSASGSAERRLETDQQIAGIVLRVIVGAFDDLASNDSVLRLWEAISSSSGQRAWTVPTLCIDGQSRTGWKSWAEAAVRVGSYAADARTDGSVGLTYRLQIRKYHIATSTAVMDGRVSKVVDAWWTEVVRIPVPKGLRWLLGNEIVRRVPTHVRIRVDATETEGTGCRTRILGTAFGSADTSEFCLDRIAERQAAATLHEELGRALDAIRRRGTDWYHGADEYTDLLDGIGDGIRGIGRRQ